VYIRRNCEHGFPKLLVVLWLGLSVTVRVRARAWDREWVFHFFLFFFPCLKVTHLCLALLG